MVEGAQKNGVKQDYVKKLRENEKQLRSKPEDFRSFGIPDGLPTWTFEDVQKGTGENDAPIYTTCNGKVFQANIEKQSPYYKSIKNLYAGQHAEI